jgi:formylglycine-generating enzyme required for sulfatase activity
MVFSICLERVGLAALEVLAMAGWRMLCTRFLLYLFALGAVLASQPSRGAAAEPTEPTTKAEVHQTWPFDAAEAKRRQEETAQRLGVPVEKALDLGNGVQLELVLIPAGWFVMGTPEPERVDELPFQEQIGIGQVALAVGASVMLAMLAFVMIRAVREKHRPQVSLARLLILALIAGIGLLGGLHWHFSERALAEARIEYQAALARFKSLDVDYVDEKPAHEVTLSTPFYMGKYEVTQEQYQEVMGKNPSQFKGRPDLPVEVVSWDDAREFCKKVSAKTGRVLRLPSEAEWEYACRAGTETLYHSGDDESSLDKAAWYAGNSKRATHPVGQKEASAFGLCDMHGNVWEWCEDDWHHSYKGAPVDGSAWIDKPRDAHRVMRGGSWYFYPGYCRSAFRFNLDPGRRCNLLGFRVVLVSSRTP